MKREELKLSVGHPAHIILSFRLCFCISCQSKDTNGCVVTQGGMNWGEVASERLENVSTYLKNGWLRLMNVWRWKEKKRGLESNNWKQWSSTRCTGEKKHGLNKQVKICFMYSLNTLLVFIISEYLIRSKISFHMFLHFVWVQTCRSSIQF